MPAFAVVAALLVALPPAQAVAERYAGAVVFVERGDRRDHGFFVSSDGVACTVLPHARAGEAVRVVTDSAVIDGVVAVIDDDGLALITPRTPPEGGVVALGVDDDDRAVGRWLVGLARTDRGVAAAVGDVDDRADDRWRALVPVPRGAPLLDEQSAVVAVAVKAVGRGRVEAVPAARLRALAARLQRQMTTTTTTTTP